MVARHTQINTSHLYYFPTSTMALNPPPLKLYDCVNFALDDTNRFAEAQGYAVLQIVRMAVEVKMPLRWLAKC
jgi:hypothetical protein